MLETKLTREKLYYTLKRVEAKAQTRIKELEEKKFTNTGTPAYSGVHFEVCIEKPDSELNGNYNTALKIIGRVSAKHLSRFSTEIDSYFVDDIYNLNIVKRTIGLEKRSQGQLGETMYWPIKSKWEIYEASSSIQLPSINNVEKAEGDNLNFLGKTRFECIARKISAERIEDVLKTLSEFTDYVIPRHG